VVALFFSVVPRGRAIGLLATKGIPLRIAADIRGGQRFLASSWASRAVAAAPSFQKKKIAFIIARKEIM